MTPFTWWPALLTRYQLVTIAPLNTNGAPILTRARTIKAVP